MTRDRDEKNHNDGHSGGQGRHALMLMALGIVFGDIGTSPLYAFRECFGPLTGLDVTPENVTGVASLVLWALILVVTVKYLGVVLRANYNGEGGTLALTILTSRTLPHGRMRSVILVIGIFGASLFFGDAIITPAISILGAVEGLEIAAPALHGLIVPVSLAIVLALFINQKRGVGRISRLFGPVVLVWFIVLLVLGASSILATPEVLASINPLYAVQLFVRHQLGAIAILGAVALVITGAEALYADLGHFGRQPIAAAWLKVAFPALAVNYLGQAALLLRDPGALRNPFYLLAPEWAVVPLVFLAALTTVIASQAVIAGAFSLARQAILYGLLPRLLIRHTSVRTRGQVYIPFINWLLFFLVCALIIAFRSSDRLGAAYGASVIGEMTATSILVSLCALYVWRWKVWWVALMMLALLSMDGLFLAASVGKIAEGGYIPLTVAGAIIFLVASWNDGRKSIARMRESNAMTIRALGKMLTERYGTGGESVFRPPGTAVFFSSSPEYAPAALLHNMKHNHVLHEQIAICHFVAEDRPRVPLLERVSVEKIGGGFYLVKIRHGFIQQPNAVEALMTARSYGLPFDIERASYFIGRKKIVPEGRKDLLGTMMSRTFVFLQENSLAEADFIGLPPNRVIEVGAQVRIP